MLDSNFSLKKYGLKVRLVNEGDAEFIVKLRSDPNRTKFMLTLDDDVQKQKEWIREYKAREKQGLDYFLIYFCNENEPVAINRISKINYDDGLCKINSWIKDKSKRVNALILFLIRIEIIFDDLNLNYFYVDVHKDNINALRYYDIFNFNNFVLKNDFRYYMISRNDFHNNLNRVKREFNLTD